jgi:hypothetical protein
VHACELSYAGNVGRKIAVQVDLDKKDLIQKITKGAGCWWLMPVILATQKAEIKRIAV